MNIILTITAMAAAVLTCGQPARVGNSDCGEQNSIAYTDTALNRTQGFVKPDTVFTLADAERILGQPGYLSDSATTTRADTARYVCGYTANSKDQKTDKQGVVYFLLEHYSRESTAHERYNAIKKANEDHEGVVVLHDLGDEAYFHSDGHNFYFVMVRQGNYVFNMKVNRITSFTSLYWFKDVARKITDNL